MIWNDVTVRLTSTCDNWCIQINIVLAFWLVRL